MKTSVRLAFLLQSSCCFKRKNYGKNYFAIHAGLSEATEESFEKVYIEILFPDDIQEVVGVLPFCIFFTLMQYMEKFLLHLNFTCMVSGDFMSFLFMRSLAESLPKSILAASMEIWMIR